MSLANDTDEGAPTILGQPIAHVGYSVESISRTVDFLVEAFGAGPFFLMEDIQLEELRNEDGPIVWEHSAAFGQWGGVGVELQEIKKLEPSNAFGATYERVNLFNHVAYAVDDLPREKDRLEGLGLDLLFESFNGPHRSLLFDAPLLGHTIEVHGNFPLFETFHAELAAAAEGWDGTEPLRPPSADIQNEIVGGG